MLSVRAQAAPICPRLTYKSQLLQALRRKIQQCKHMHTLLLLSSDIVQQYVHNWTLRVLGTGEKSHDVLPLLDVLHHKAAPPCHFRETHCQAPGYTQQQIHVLANHTTRSHSSMSCRAASQTLRRITLALLQQTGALTACCAATLALATLVRILAVAPTPAVLLTKVVGLRARARAVAPLLWITAARNIL